MRNHNAAKYLTFMLVYLFTASGMAAATDSLMTISGLLIDEKQNGILIYTRTSGLIDRTNISGWVTDRNWVYLTVYRAQSDTAVLNRNFSQGPVRRIEASNSEESTQIAIRLSRPIQSLEFFTDPDPPGISFTLIYPERLLATAEPVSEPDMVVQSDISANSKLFLPWYKPLKKSLYLFGTILSVSGIISSDQSNSSGSELSIGLGVLAGTLLFDLYIFPRIIEKRMATGAEKR